MKIIGIINNYGTSEDNHSIYLMADSSLLKDGKPFFLPDFDAHFCMYPSLVIKMCRLGKNISKRFAHRYYNEYAVGIGVRAQLLLSKLNTKSMPWAEAVAFDSSAIMGEFQHIDNPEELNNFEFTVWQNDTPVSDWKISELQIDIDSMIEYISQRFTIKIGDMIYLGFPNDGFECHIDDKIMAKAGDKTLLDFKVK